MTNAPLHDRIEQLTTERDAYAKRTTELGFELTSANTSVREQQAEINKLAGLVAGADAHITELTEQRSEARTTVGKLERQIEELRTDLQDRRIENGNLKEELMIITIENARLKGYIDRVDLNLEPPPSSEPMVEVPLSRLTGGSINTGAYKEAYGRKQPLPWYRRGSRG